MTTKRHHGPTGTDLAAALLIFIAGAAFGAVSVTVLGTKTMTQGLPLPQETSQPTPDAPTGEPILEPDSPAAESPAVPAVYRGVVDSNDGTALIVTVTEGVVSPVSVTVTAATSAKITALIPAPASSGAVRRADGTLPPPLEPSASSPYKEEPRRIRDFTTGDVIEFSADAGIADGATVEAAYVTWIFSTLNGVAPGPIGGGGQAPLN